MGSIRGGLMAVLQEGGIISGGLVREGPISGGL